jgi:tetratricopeptide (TPR) repeat protein
MRTQAFDGVKIIVQTDPVPTELVTITIGSLVGASFGLADVKLIGDESTCTSITPPSTPASGYSEIVSRLHATDFLALSTFFPRNARAGLGLGRFLWKEGRREDALAVVEQALIDDPRVANAWIEVGLMHDRNGRPARARRYYERALALDRYNAWGRGCLAWSLVRDGKPLRALYQARLAARYDERYADAHTIAGMAKRSLGMSDSALRSFERAVHLDPRRDWAYIEMSKFHLDAGKVQHAERTLRRYLKLVPDDERMAGRLAALVDREKRRE